MSDGERVLMWVESGFFDVVVEEDGRVSKWKPIEIKEKEVKE